MRRLADGALPTTDHDTSGEGIVGELHEVAHDIMDGASGGVQLGSGAIFALETRLEDLASELGIEDLHEAAEQTLMEALEGLDDPVREAAQSVRCRKPKGGKRTTREKGKKHRGVKMRSDKRLAIYLRDGLRCMYCDEDLLGKWLQDPSSVHLDHVLPRSKRGKDSPVNLITTCDACNLSRQDKPLSKFTDEDTIKKIQRNLKRNVCLLLPLIKAWIIEKSLQRQLIQSEELEEAREKAQERYTSGSKRNNMAPKYISIEGELFERIAQEEEKSDSWRKKVTPVPPKKLDEEEPKKPKKWKARLLKLLNFPPEKIKKLTGVEASSLDSRNWRFADQDAEIASWLQQNLEKYRKEGDLKGFISDMGKKFGEDVAQEAAGLLQQATEASVPAPKRIKYKGARYELVEAAEVWTPQKGDKVSLQGLQEAFSQWIDDDTLRQVEEILDEGGKDALQQADRLLEHHGTEEIRDEDVWDNYYGDAVALYSNSGDTYNVTVIYDIEEGEFYLTSYGDWLEAYEHQKKLEAEENE